MANNDTVYTTCFLFYKRLASVILFFLSSFLLESSAANKIVQYRVLGICFLYPMFLDVFFTFFVAY